MSRLQLTVRLFAFTDRSGFALPRRGAVKVWSAGAERLVVQNLARMLDDPRHRPGLAEIRLDLSPEGRPTAVRMETSSGAPETDAALVAGLTSGLRLPALPNAVQTASFLLLIELAPTEAAVESLA